MVACVRPCLTSIDSLEGPAFGTTSETRCEGGDRRTAVGFDGSPVVGGGGRLGTGGGRANDDVNMRGADAVGGSTIAKVCIVALSLTVPERVLLLRIPVGSDASATGFRDRLCERSASRCISSSIFGTLLGVGTSMSLIKGYRGGSGISVEG